MAKNLFSGGHASACDEVVQDKLPPRQTGVVERLRLALRDARFTQREFARQLGVSSSYLNDVITERKRPSSDLLVAIRRVLGVSIDWLLTGEADRAPVAEVQSYGNLVLESGWMARVRLLNAIARAAELEGDAVAVQFIERVETQRALPTDPAFSLLADRVYAPPSDEEALLISIFSSCMALPADDEGGRVVHALREAASHYKNVRKRSSGASVLLTGASDQTRNLLLEARHPS